MKAMLLRTTISTFLLAAAFAAPAVAQEPPAPALVTPLNACYVVAQQEQRELIGINAANFTPFNEVEVFIDDLLQDRARVQRGGEVTGQVRAPFTEEGTRPFTLRISEIGNPARTLVAQSLVTRLSVQQSPPSASTSQRVRFKGRGFMDFAAPVYAHYVFAGKVRKSVRLGLPKGPCGTFSVRRKQFPFKKSPRIGVWTIQFDQIPRYNPKAAARVPMTIKVRKAA